MNHPYKELEEHPLWNVLKEGIEELEENNDISMTAHPSYVVGYLLKKLSKVKSDHHGGFIDDY
jgi:hypothetical protein